MIWFGGISRTGTVFVHRPSLRDEDLRLDFDAWESAVNEAQNDIQSYLHEMRIMDSVSDAMLSTNPNDLAPIKLARMLLTRIPFLKTTRAHDADRPCPSFKNSTWPLSKEAGSKAVKVDWTM